MPVFFQTPLLLYWESLRRGNYTKEQAPLSSVDVHKQANKEFQLKRSSSEDL